ncbi:MAG TPA: acyltransferase [Candidatus Sulfotelmatobacter sp.]|nr:acyltransferase [Candidatus Sulfotelmatobacter sp.]
MKRIPSLDGLRAISIAAVVVGHILRGRGYTSVFGSYGNTGVRIFFVISGFLITRLMLNEHTRTSAISLKDFYVRRAYRILPAALVFVAAAVIIDWQEMTWLHVGAAVFYLADYDYAVPWVFRHLWSLSVEEQFYLLWPAVLKRWYNKRVQILVAVSIFAPLLHLVLYAFKVPGGGYGLFPVLTDNLAIGCLLAVLEPRIPRIPGYTALLMTFAIVFIPLYVAPTVPRTLFSVLILHPIFLISIAGVIAHVVQTPYRFLNRWPTDWIGRISYSLYLWQEPFCPNPRYRPLTALVLALSAACISYYVVERPALRLREKRSKARKQEVATAYIAA